MASCERRTHWALETVVAGAEASTTLGGLVPSPTPQEAVPGACAQSRGGQESLLSFSIFGR